MLQKRHIPVVVVIGLLTLGSTRADCVYRSQSALMASPLGEQIRSCAQLGRTIDACIGDFAPRAGSNLSITITVSRDADGLEQFTSSEARCPQVGAPVVHLAPWQHPRQTTPMPMPAIPLPVAPSSLPVAASMAPLRLPEPPAVPLYLPDSRRDFLMHHLAIGVAAAGRTVDGAPERGFGTFGIGLNSGLDAEVSDSHGPGRSIFRVSGQLTLTTEVGGDVDWGRGTALYVSGEAARLTRRIGPAFYYGIHMVTDASQYDPRGPVEGAGSFTVGRFLGTAGFAVSGNELLFVIAPAAGLTAVQGVRQHTSWRSDAVSEFSGPAANAGLVVRLRYRELQLMVQSILSRQFSLPLSGSQMVSDVSNRVSFQFGGGTRFSIFMAVLLDSQIHYLPTGTTSEFLVNLLAGGTIGAATGCRGQGCGR